VLYLGLPIVMKPDPPHAFGLFFMTCLLLILVTGLTCFLTVWYVHGRFTKLDAAVERIAGFLPF
jgi:hypothetical protein